MNQSKKIIRLLRALSHQLKPVVTVGKQGLSHSVLEETLEALKAHELIKLKFLPKQKAMKKNFMEEICQHSGAILIKEQGNIMTIFLQRKENSKFDF